MIYFDNGATTWPKPPAVRQSILEAMEHYGANPGRAGHEMSIATAVMVTQTRERAAQLFDLPQPEQVIFTQNCTHGLNIAIQGLLRPGDHVIISDLEHNSVLRPVYRLAKEGTISFDIAVTVPGDPDATVEAFARCIRPCTRLMVCTHGSNVFGFVQPVRQLAGLAREKGILFLVDAAQTAGLLEIPMTKWGIDYLCTAGHKGLYGPSGTGLLLVNNEQLPRPLMVGGTGSLSAKGEQPDFLPDALESGTVNTAGIIGLGAGLAFLQEKGLESIRHREMTLVHRLWRGLESLPGVELYGDAPQLPVVSFTVRGQASEETAAGLDQRGAAVRAGLHCAPLAHNKMGTMERGTVRASLGAFNTADEVDTFCRDVASLLP